MYKTAYAEQCTPSGWKSRERALQSLFPPLTEDFKLSIASLAVLGCMCSVNLWTIFFYLRPVFRDKLVIIKYSMSNKTVFLKLTVYPIQYMAEELYKFNVILRWFSTVCYPDHWIISSELLVPISVIFWAPLKGR